MRDDWAGWLGVIAFVGGIYWFSSNYEIRRTVDGPIATPSAVASPYRQPRPTGMVEIGEAKGGMVLRLNADSVRGDRTNRQGWVIEDAAKDRTASWRYRHVLYLIDCNTTAIRTLSTIYYDAKGNSPLPARHADPKDAKPEYYPDGTVGYIPVRGMCGDEFDAPK